jgi:hypothetical protein
MLATHTHTGCRIQMDIESRKSEEKDACKKVDLEIEVRYMIGLGPPYNLRMR